MWPGYIRALTDPAWQPSNWIHAGPKCNGAKRVVLFTVLDGNYRTNTQIRPWDVKCDMGDSEGYFLDLMVANAHRWNPADYLLTYTPKSREEKQQQDKIIQQYKAFQNACKNTYKMFAKIDTEKENSDKLSKLL